MYDVKVKKTLLLNADWSPLFFISGFRALMLLFKGKAEVIKLDGTSESLWAGELITTTRENFPVPATIRLNKRVTKKWKPTQFKKRVLFSRDCWRCQYCGKELNWTSVTIDHVMPVSRGGTTSWLNCVACCHSCNKKKDNQTPEEAGMPLLAKPRIPTSMDYNPDISVGAVWHPDWDGFVSRPNPVRSSR